MNINNNGSGNSIFSNKWNNDTAANNLINLEQQYQALLRNNNGNLNNFNGAFAARRTVFNDVADEWNNCSDEERKFIEQDEEYAAANVAYLQSFNAFLIEAFGVQFASSQYGTSAEKLLIALKNARKKYRSAAADDVMKMKNENAELMRKLKELEEKMSGKAVPVVAAKGGTTNGR